MAHAYSLSPLTPVGARALATQDAERHVDDTLWALWFTAIIYSATNLLLYMTLYRRLISNLNRDLVQARCERARLAGLLRKRRGTTGGAAALKRPRFREHSPCSADTRPPPLLPGRFSCCCPPTW